MEYGQFLLLKLVYGDTRNIRVTSLTPSEPIDAVWHFHMLHPQNYAMCESVCRHVVDHDPDNDCINNQPDVKTYRSYAALFGENPPVEYWSSLPVPEPRKRKQV